MYLRTLEIFALSLEVQDEEVSQKFTEIFSKKYNIYVGYETKSTLELNDEKITEQDLISIM